MSTSNLVIGSASENTLKVGEYGDAEGTAVDVGFTDGGVEFNYSSEEKEIFVDQHLGPVDSITIKESLIIKVNIAEASLANLALACGYPVGAVSGSTFSFGDKADGRDPKTAYVNVKGPGPGTRKITIWKAKIKGALSQKYTKDNVTFVPVEISALCDTTKTAEQRFGTVVDTGLDSTPPTVALQTPADGGTVVKNTAGTVVWLITEVNGVDENTIRYGDTFSIINTTVAASAALVAGSIVYSAVAKTVTFTPTGNWTASDTFQAIVTKGLKDSAGNSLAAIKIEQFSVTA